MLNLIKIRFMIMIVIFLSLLNVSCVKDKDDYMSNTRYMLTERYNRPFQDVNKTYKGDGKMCWAASIANMVGFVLDHNPKTVFNFLKNNYGNTPRSLYSGLSVLFKSMGYTEEKLLMIISIARMDLNKRMDLFIIGTLYQSKVINIGIDKGDVKLAGHALTVYGFEVVDKKLYIFYVDSNDGIHKLYREQIKHKEGITRIITGEWKGCIISTVTGLQVTDLELDD